MNTSELDTHLTELFEGRLEGEAFDRLQEELRNSEEARLAYRDYARLQNALDVRAEGVDTMNVIPMDLVIKRRHKRNFRTAGLVAAAVLLLGGIAMIFTMIQTPPPMLTFATSPGTTFSLSSSNAEEGSTDAILLPGSRLEIYSGTVELTFASGVRGIIRGPADLTLHREDLLYLGRGTGWFEVPPDAVGFKVNTPDLSLTDLGTEFGIRSRPEFLDEVHVFTGKVEVTNRYGLKKNETIEAGQARVAGPAGRWKEIPVEKSTFLTELPSTDPGRVENAILYDDFEKDTSGDYVCVDYYKGGECPDRFNINSDDNGVLEIAAAGIGQNGGQLIHRSAQLKTGQAFRVDWLTPAHSGYAIAQVLTDTPDGKRYCVRMRVNDGAYVIDFARGQKGSIKWVDQSPYTAPETFWIERISDTEFSWFRGTTDDERVKIAEVTFDSNPGDLHVGVQTWATTARFDNLAIVPTSKTGE